MGAIKDLWQSERGLVAVALIAATTVMFALGYIPHDEWLAHTKWVFLTYATAKTITGTALIAKSRPSTTPSPSSKELELGPVEMDSTAGNGIFAGGVFGEEAHKVTDPDFEEPLEPFIDGNIIAEIIAEEEQEQALATQATLPTRPGSSSLHVTQTKKES